MNWRSQAYSGRLKTVVSRHIMTELDLNESETTNLKDFIYGPIDFPQLAWKSDLHRWSSRRNLAEKEIVRI